MTNMRKTWRNPRQVIVILAQAEPENTKRRERLVVLLATGLERMLSQKNGDMAQSLDFKPEVSNTCVGSTETKTVVI